MNFAVSLPAVFVAGSFRQLIPKGSLREAPGYAAAPNMLQCFPLMHPKDRWC